MSAMWDGLEKLSNSMGIVGYHLASDQSHINLGHPSLIIKIKQMIAEAKKKEGGHQDRETWEDVGGKGGRTI